MRVLLLILAFMCASTAHARTVFCDIEDRLGAPEFVTWNDETNVAKISLPVEGVLVGEVTLRFKSGSGNDGVNISFLDIPAPWKDGEWEYLVHEPVKGEFVVFGVGYKFIEGRRHLSSLRGTYSAQCHVL